MLLVAASNFFELGFSDVGTPQDANSSAPRAGYVAVYDLDADHGVVLPAELAVRVGTDRTDRGADALADRRCV